MNASPRLVEFARRAQHCNMREAIELQMIANELRDKFEGRILPQSAQWLISGLIADLSNYAAKLMEPQQ